jgi:hypothetical protein
MGIKNIFLAAVAFVPVTLAQQPEYAQCRLGKPRISKFSN